MKNGSFSFISWAGEFQSTCTSIYRVVRGIRCRRANADDDETFWGYLMNGRLYSCLLPTKWSAAIQLPYIQEHIYMEGTADLKQEGLTFQSYQTILIEPCRVPRLQAAYPWIPEGYQVPWWHHHKIAHFQYRELILCYHWARIQQKHLQREINKHD